MRASLALLFFLAGLSAASCADYRGAETRFGREYLRWRTEILPDGRSVHIGLLARRVEIGGLTYRGWLHSYEDGRVREGRLADPGRAGGFDVPRGSWLRFGPKGELATCVFPKASLVAGLPLRGSLLGPEGVAASFHPEGGLKRFYLSRSAVIEGIPCAAGLRSPVELDSSGRLLSCTIAAEVRIGDRIWRRGERYRTKE